MHSFKQKKITARTTMYNVVFDSTIVKFCVFFLFAFLLLQPVAPAFANGEEGASEPAPSDVIDDEPDAVESLQEEESEMEEVDQLGTEDDNSEVIDEQLESSSEVNQSTEDAEVIESEDGQSLQEGSEEVAVEEVAENETATTTTSVVSDIDDAATQDEISGETSTTTEALPTTEVTTSTTTPVEDSSPEVIVPNDEVLAQEEEVPQEETVPSDDSVADDDSSSTTTLPTVPAEPPVQFSDLNKYQFGAQECVGVGDGAYYCSKTTSQNSNAQESGIYSAKDDSGDLEIYITLDEETVQLSDNTVEDGAPFYDAESETVVWHRLENGRHEIIQYNLRTSEEKYITTNTINDTEPTVSGDYIVWQRWVQDNWEIMLFDGVDEKQLTENATHDIAPHIKGGYVIWHATGQDGQTHIGVYEIETGLTSTIADTDSGSVENPRFVLVYDTTYENGDIVTKGYDFESKAVVPLSAVPYELPTELPNPDSTGETRALIQNKSPNSKDVAVEDQVSNDPYATGTSTQTSGNQSATSTSSQPSESVSESGATLDLAATSTLVMELTDFDLVVTPYEASSSAQDVNSASSTNFVE